MSLHMNVRVDEVFDEGDYRAILENLEQKATKFGERLMWTFRLPDEDGEVVGFTSMSPSTRANAYQWVQAIMGGIDPKVGWGTEDVNGGECVVVLEVAEDAQGVKKNKVVKVKPANNGGAFPKSGGSPDDPDIDRIPF